MSETFSTEDMAFAWESGWRAAAPGSHPDALLTPNPYRCNFPPRLATCSQPPVRGRVLCTYHLTQLTLLLGSPDVADDGGCPAPTPDPGKRCIHPDDNRHPRAEGVARHGDIQGAHWTDKDYKD